MTGPKLHHYVPQFHLRRFCDDSGRLWAWDKTKDVSFLTQPGRVAAETGFYKTDNSGRRDPDPLAMEKQFADLEADVARVTDQWLGWFEDLIPNQPIEVPETNRATIALYIALQYLRTADVRDLLCALEDDKPLTTGERASLHAALLWDDKIVHGLRDHLAGAIWIFGRNNTETPFVTSDNPVAFRTPDNRQWLRVGVRAPGVYGVFPLSPSIVMYLYPRDKHTKKLARFDQCVSPVESTSEMVASENAGQVFMATRFVFSSRNNFDFEREFAKSIGTDLYAPKAT